MDLWFSQQIKQIKKGNHKAFSVIIDKYQNKIYLHCYRMVGNHHDAQELTQETFLKAYANIAKFKERKKFTPWLYRIATNLAIDHIRKKKPLYILDQEVNESEKLTLVDQMESSTPLPEDVLLMTEQLDKLQEHLIQLPPKYRAVLIFRYVHDMSLQEIANTLDLPIGTVKTHLYRGREVLRKRIREAVRG